MFRLQWDARKFVLNSLRGQFVLEPRDSIYLVVPLPFPCLLNQSLSLFQDILRNLLFEDSVFQWLDGLGQVLLFF